jgi:8-hydroxy-5-deazaflavin:NADPH oxidoreductase
VRSVARWCWGGAGHIGGTLAKLFVAAGHEVAVSNSRGPDTLAGLVEELGGRAQAMTTGEAERFGRSSSKRKPNIRWGRLGLDPPHRSSVGLVLSPGDRL